MGAGNKSERASPAGAPFPCRESACGDPKPASDIGAEFEKAGSSRSAPVSRRLSWRCPARNRSACGMGGGACKRGANPSRTPLGNSRCQSGQWRQRCVGGAPRGNNVPSYGRKLSPGGSERPGEGKSAVSGKWRPEKLLLPLAWTSKSIFFPRKPGSQATFKILVVACSWPLKMI